jgi:hypothetical protein
MRLNHSHVLANGVVFAAPFTEGSGLSIYDLSSSAVVGALTGGPTWQASPFGWALNFDGNNDYVDLGNPAALQITGNISIVVYVYYTAASLSGIILAKDKDTGGRAYTFDFNSGGSPNGLRFYINGGGGSNIVHTNGVFPANNVWHQFVGTYNIDGTLTLYVDGAQVAQQTGAASSIPTATANVTIGRREYAGFEGYFPGSIQNVSIYNRTLSAAEVANLYVDPFAIYRQPDYRWLKSSTAASLSININDSLTVSEGITINNTNLGGINVSDALTITESVTVTIFGAGTNLAISVNDALTITESVTINNTNLGGISVSDAISITESVTITNTNLGGISVSDALTITDVVTIGRENNINLSDSLTITEGITVTNTTLGGISISDALSISESVTITNTNLGGISVSDALTITESVSLLLIQGFSAKKNVVIMRSGAQARPMAGDIQAYPPKMDSKAQSRPLGMDDNVVI